MSKLRVVEVVVMSLVVLARAEALSLLGEQGRGVDLVAGWMQKQGV